MNLFRLGPVVLGATLLCAPITASAQYDREGRYVPSPMGVPADPYARPIPGYSGKPGAARGTPAWPRAYDLKPSPPPRIRREAERVYVPPSSLPKAIVQISKKQCREGWSPDTDVPRVLFNRRCRVLLSR